MSVPAALAAHFDPASSLSSHRTPTLHLSPNLAPPDVTQPYLQPTMSSDSTSRAHGQNHDREGSSRGETGGSSSGGRHSHTSSPAGSEDSEEGDSEEDGEDDDMDTSPDGPASETAPSSAEALNQLPTIPPLERPNTSLVRVSSTGSSIHSDHDTDMEEVRIPAPSAEVGLVLSAVFDVPTAIPEFDDDGDDISFDGDEPIQLPWRPLHEDTSVPSEEELQKINETTEFSALDHAHWEAQTFTALDDPELLPLETGRIEWQVENYNGTKDKPNTERIIRSQTVQIGGYDWRIKFFPKGNDSDYLSVYIECPTLLAVDQPKLGVSGSEESSGDLAGPHSSKNDSSQVTESREHGADAIAVVDQKNETRELQHCPLPALGSEPKFKRQSIAAQISVVLFNPAEPRVHHFNSATHRFCPNSADWGWTRFHGPLYEIQYRRRGQRQALLRNDKLAFTAYIRLVEDPTGCMWEHPTGENQWDSFAMTGLQSLQDHLYPMAGGNLISTIASFLLYKPFRKLLYDIEVLDLANNPLADTKQPLVAALQRVLYVMRRQSQPNAAPVPLDHIHGGLVSSGIEITDKQDVVEVMEILKTVLDHELRDTNFRSRLHELLGPPGIRPRLSVRDSASIVEALAAAEPHLSALERYGTPEVLPLELHRQQFSRETRKWSKLVNKVALDERIFFNSRYYLLYGFVVHEGDLQSGSYFPVLRPGGPSGRWYVYGDGRTGNKVVCKTKLAVERYQGARSDENQDESMAVAYLVMYIREDVAADAFALSYEPHWNIPAWLESPPTDPFSGPFNAQSIQPGASLGIIDTKMDEFVPPPDDGGPERLPTPFNVFRSRDSHLAGYTGCDIVFTDDLDVHLRYLNDLEKFPQNINGVRELSYFSDEYYEGGMDQNTFHGRGNRIYHNGDVYSGPFWHGYRDSPARGNGQDDRPERLGTMVYANGDIYTGTWADNLPHGRGTFTEAATGNMYEGGWRKGKKFGEGVTRWKVAEQEEKLCRVCYDKDVDTAFVDCGHVIACGECAGRMVGSGCAVCRRDVRGTLRLWWT